MYSRWYDSDRFFLCVAVDTFEKLSTADFANQLAWDLFHNSPHIKKLDDSHNNAQSFLPVDGVDASSRIPRGITGDAENLMSSLVSLLSPVSASSSDPRGRGLPHDAVRNAARMCHLWSKHKNGVQSPNLQSRCIPWQNWHSNL